MKWEANLNLQFECLTFVVGGESLYALHDGNMVNQEGYAAIVASVQNDCKGKFFPFFAFFPLYFHCSIFVIVVSMFACTVIHGVLHYLGCLTNLFIFLR